MIVHEGFDRTVAAWLDEEAGHRPPDYLDEVLARTLRTRQRPAWSGIERWLPMQATARLAPAFPRATIRLGLALLLTLALLAAALLVGVGRQRLPGPFGPARNGDYAYGEDGDLYRFDPSTGDRSPLVTGPGWDFGAGYSRDGTRMAFGRLTGDPSLVPAGDPEPGLAIMLADVDGGHIRQLTPPLDGQCWSDWSPDSRQQVFRTARPDGYGVLNILDIDAGTFQTIDPGISVRCSTVAYRPPDGREIIFRGDSATEHGVYAIHPNGTGFRRVNAEIPTCDCDTGPSVSADGRFLAVDRWDAQGFVRLWILDLDSGTERLLPLPAGMFSRGGTFSPDGTLIAFPMLHRIGPSRNAYQVAIAPLDGRAPPRPLGPEMELPPNGSDEAFVSIVFSPDGKDLIAGYPDSPTSTSSTIWILPVDGSQGREVGAGTFASLDIQRRAP